jgi:hypothetical protein
MTASYEEVWKMYQVSEAERTRLRRAVEELATGVKHREVMVQIAKAALTPEKKD